MDGLAVADLKGIVVPLNFTQPMAEKLASAVEGNPLGFAVLCSRHERGCQLYIMYQRIVDVDSSVAHQLIVRRSGREQILGRILIWKTRS